MQARGIQTRADETVQQVAVVADARQASATAAITNQDGYMWVGSAQKSNLTQDGQPVPPPQVRKNEQYTTVPLNIFLRSGLPDENYVQQPSVGVVAPYSRVQALDVPVSFDRPTGQQYWLKVRVLTSASLPTVYFQYTAAPKVTAPAQALSQKLKTIGYKLPGEERVDTAQGRREVRYFYAPDKDDAERLAQDTTKALAELGSPRQAGGNDAVDAGLLRQEERARRARIVARPDGDEGGGEVDRNPLGSFDLMSLRRIAAHGCANIRITSSRSSHGSDVDTGTRRRATLKSFFDPAAPSPLPLSNILRR